MLDFDNGSEADVQQNVGIPPERVTYCESWANCLRSKQRPTIMTCGSSMSMCLGYTGRRNMEVLQFVLPETNPSACSFNDCVLHIYSGTN